MTSQTTTRTRRLLAVLVSVSLIAIMFVGCAPAEGTREIDTGLRTENPELFLESALELSGLDAGAFTDFYPDFSAFDLSRFEGGPTEHNFSFRINQSDQPQLVGTEFDIGLLMDAAANNYLLNLDVSAGPISVSGNRIFISPDLIALSVPDLLTRYQYVSVNPNTFAADWNASDFAAMLGEVDTGDIEMALAMITEMSNMLDFSSMAGFMEGYIKQLERMNEDLMAASEFVDSGDTTITVGGNTYNVARLGYYTPAQVMEEFMGEAMDLVFDIVLDLMDGLMGVAAMADPTLDAGMLRQEMQSAINQMSFTFPEGITTYYYVDMDTGLVRRSTIEDMTMVMDAGFGHTEQSTSSIVTYYLGEVNVADITHTFMTMEDGFGNIIESEMRMYIPEGGPYTFFMHMDMGRDGTVTFEMGYDPTATGNNIWMEMEIEDNFMQVALDIRGELVDDAGEFALRNGQMTAIEGGSTVLAVSFDYALRNVASGDVSIDQGAATDLFEVDLAALEQDLAMIMMMMSMI